MVGEPFAVAQGAVLLLFVVLTTFGVKDSAWPDLLQVRLGFECYLRLSYTSYKLSALVAGTVEQGPVSRFA